MRSTTARNVTLAATLAMTLALAVTSLSAAQRGVAPSRDSNPTIGYTDRFIASIKRFIGVTIMGEPQVPIPAVGTAPAPTAPTTSTTTKK